MAYKDNTGALQTTTYQFDGASTVTRTGIWNDRVLLRRNTNGTLHHRTGVGGERRTPSLCI